MLYCVFCCWLLVTITAKLVTCPYSVSFSLLSLVLSVLLEFVSVSVLYSCLIITILLYGRPAWWAVGFSGSPLLCLFTIFALLYFVFLFCSWQINMIDWYVFILFVQLFALRNATEIIGKKTKQTNIREKRKKSLPHNNIKVIWRPKRQNARVSKITNDGLIRSGTGCFIVVPIWQLWRQRVKLLCRFYHCLLSSTYW